MRGLIDLYKLKDLYSGLGQVCYHLGLNLMKNKGALELDYLIPDHSVRTLFGKDSSINYLKSNFRNRYFPFLNRSYAFWHSMNQFPSHFPDSHTPMILTVHDLNFLVEKNRDKAMQYLKKLQRNTDRADYITAISQFTKNELIKNVDLKGKEVKVIYNGVPPNNNVESKKPEYVHSGNFLFSLGVFKNSKNFHTLLPLINHFDNYQLIIAGNTDTPYGRTIKERVSEMQCGDKIVLPGIINEQDKQWLYNHCTAFLFPSTAEGFGIPVVEAMKAGKPVFISKYASLPEIGGDLAFYFDSFDETEMAGCIRTNLNKFQENPAGMREKMISYSSKFDWETCAGQYLELYNLIMNNRR